MHIGINVGGDVWEWRVSDEKTLRAALKDIKRQTEMEAAIDAIHASRRKRPNMWPEGV